MNREVKLIDGYDFTSKFSYLNEDNTDKFDNTKPVSNEIKENSKLKGVIGKIGGIGADSNQPTRNGRRYPLKLWQNVEKSEYFIEGMKNRCIVGECDHPNERIDYSIPEGAIVLTKYEIQSDGKVYTEFDILDTLPGRTVKTYFDAGCKLGVSSRGLGEEIMENGEKIIDPETYQFYCFDAVMFPAVKSARMELIESTSPKRQTLINSIKKEINNCTSLNECLYIESMAKAADLYLDEIKEAIENKIKELDNEDNTKKLARSIIDKIDKKDNKTVDDSQLSDFLKAWLGESMNLTDIKSLIKDMENKIKEYKDLGDSITREESDKCDLLQKILFRIRDLNWSEVDEILNESFKYDNTDFTSIKDLDEPEKAYQATKAYLDQLKKLKSNATENDKYMMGWLEAELKDYEDYKKNNPIKNESTGSIKITKINSKVCENVNYDVDMFDLIKSLKQILSTLEDKENDEILSKDEKDTLDFLKSKIDILDSIEWDSIDNILDKYAIKKENNKIKITEHENNSDEDTPEILSNDSDNNLEILAELQDEVALKNSEIKKFNNTIEQKNAIIRGLVSKQHNNTLDLQERINKLTHEIAEKDESFNSLLKKYENLKKANLDLNNIFESIKEDISITKNTNSDLTESVKILELDKDKLNKKNTELMESLKINEISHNKVQELTESITSLKNENEMLLLENNKQAKQINKINNEKIELNKQYQESLDKYIENVCNKYNIKSDILVRLLGETYTIKDIDKVAKELAENISKVNSLPFKNVIPQRRVYNENIGLVNENFVEPTEDLSTFSFMLESKK